MIRRQWSDLVHSVSLELRFGKISDSLVRSVRNDKAKSSQLMAVMIRALHNSHVGFDNVSIEESDWIGSVGAMRFKGQWFDPDSMTQPEMGVNLRELQDVTHKFCLPHEFPRRNLNFLASLKHNFAQPGFKPFSELYSLTPRSKLLTFSKLPCVSLR